MIQNNLQWTSPDGLNFFAHTWQPDNKPQAVITLVHGLGEHCLRYTPYFDFLVKNNIAILGFDLRGHGQTEGKRGVIKSYQRLLDDIDIAVLKTKELFPDIPHFIYGHSMGGNLALNYLMRKNHNLTGGIITSPWLILANDPNFILKAIVSFLKGLLPNITIDSGLEIDYISSDKNEVEKYRNDKLNHGRISFKLFSTITSSGIWAIANIKKLQTPILLMHGSGDKITSHQASKLIAKNNPDFIEYVEWENRYHELHNETNRPNVAQKVIDWIKAKTK